MENPPPKQKARNFATFLYDADSGQVCGRHCRNWAEITVYYMIYYSCLLAFFAATLAVFYESISIDEPRLTGDDSLLNGNPGLAFRPRPDPDSTEIFAKPILGKNKKYVDNLNDFLQPYKTHKTSKPSQDCLYIEKPRERDDAIPCKVDYFKLTKQCSPENDYGMADGKPCVLIKLNKVYGWIPELWDVKDDDIPSDVQQNYKKSIVPIRCYTKDSKETSKLGTIKYHSEGFSVAFYPFKRQMYYLAPVIFVQFINMTRDYTFDVECRVYAKNIEYDKENHHGLTTFKLRVSET